MALMHEPAFCFFHDPDHADVDAQARSAAKREAEFATAYPSTATTPRQTARREEGGWGPVVRDEVWGRAAVEEEERLRALAAEGRVPSRGKGKT